MQPREPERRPPWFGVETREINHIVAHVSAKHGRRPRALAVWCALLYVANEKRSMRFVSRLGNLAERIGSSPDFVSAGLVDLEDVGLVRRIGSPTTQGETYELYSPLLAVSGPGTHR